MKANLQETYQTFYENEEFIETILHNLPFGIAVNDSRDGKTIFINEKFQEIYGYTLEELANVDLFFEKVYPDEDYRNFIKEKIMADIASCDPERLQWNNITITTSKGEEKIINAKNILLPDQHLVISTVLDVTQSSKLIAENQRTKINYESILNASDDLIWSVDKNLCLLSANDAYKHLIKMLTGNLPAEGDIVLLKEFGEEWNNKWKGYYDQVFAGKQVTVTEQLYNPVNHLQEYRLVTLSPIFDATKAPFGIACYSKDVTAETVNQLKLKAAQQQLKKIMDSSLDIICAVDENGYFIQVNAASERIWGYKPEELVGKYLLDYVCREDREKTASRAAAVMDGVILPDFENRYVRKDGSLVDIEWTAGWDANDKIRYGVARDVTEKKKREASLIESEKKYKNLFANNPMPLIIWDFKTGNILDCNEASLLKYGYSREEFLSLNLKDIGSREDVGIFNELAENQLRGERISNKVWRHNKKDGELMYVDISGHLVDYNGKKASLIMLNDITERKLADVLLDDMHENLQKQAKDLAMSNSELEKFAYVASHDLQEPLRMISSFLMQLEKNYKPVLDERGKKYIEFAVDGAQRMKQIINDLLEYSKVGKTGTKKNLIDLNKLVKEIQILLRQKIEEKNAILLVDDLPVLNVYKSPMHQVFQNLIGNALKYSKENVPVQIHIGVKEFSDHWQFAVKDNGIGINEKYYHSIFVIFQRLHNNEIYSGTGMGLALTKKIVENMGGNIWVESTEGAGSIFYFTIEKEK
ncbi:hypothetical protein BH11BAC3_BH11BAC3_22480 [soil metagenome]